MTITWSIGACRSWKNLARAAGSLASKAAVRCAPSFQRRLPEPVGIAAGEDDIGTLGPGPPGGLQPDARAAADHDDGLSGQLRLALRREPGWCAGHDSSDESAGRRSRCDGACERDLACLLTDRVAICASIGLAGCGMSAISMRSAFSAAS